MNMLSASMPRIAGLWRAEELRKRRPNCTFPIDGRIREKSSSMILLGSQTKLLCGSKLPFSLSRRGRPEQLLMALEVFLASGREAATVAYNNLPQDFGLVVFDLIHRENGAKAAMK